MAEHGSSLYTRNPMSTGECDEWRLFAPDGRFFTGGVALAIFQTLFSLLTAVRFPENNICPWRLNNFCVTD